MIQKEKKFSPMTLFYLLPKCIRLNETPMGAAFLHFFHSHVYGKRISNVDMNLIKSITFCIAPFVLALLSLRSPLFLILAS